MAVSRHLGFDRTANSAIQSGDPENHSPEPNMELDRMHCLRDIHL